VKAPIKSKEKMVSKIPKRARSVRLIKLFASAIDTCMLSFFIILTYLKPVFWPGGVFRLKRLSFLTVSLLIMCYLLQVQEGFSEDSSQLKGLSEQVEQAEGLSLVGEYKSAEAIYGKIIAQNPNHKLALVGRANVRSRQKKYEEAAKDFEAILVLSPDDIDALIGLAHIFAWSGNYPEAEVQFKKGLLVDATRMDAKTGLANVVLWQEKFDEAAPLFSELHDAHPNDLEVLVGLARSTFSSGDETTAKIAYQKILAVEPKNTEALQRIESITKRELKDLEIEADRLSSQGDFGAAEVIYEKILDKNPSNEQALFYLAHIHSRQKKYDQATEGFKKVIELNNSNIDALIGLAYTLAWSENYSEAHNYFKKALDLDSSRVDARKGLAYASLWRGWKGDATMALKEFEILSEEFPRRADVLLGLGRAKVAAGDLRGAQGVFKLAVQVDGGNVAAKTEFEGVRNLLRKQLLEKAKELTAENKFSEAEVTYDQLIADSDLDEHLYFLRSETRSRQKKYELAVDDLQRVLELKPDHIDALIGLGYVLAWSERYPEAGKHFKKAAKLDPSRVDAIKGLGDVLMWQGDAQKAIEAFEALHKRKPEDIAVLIALGRAKLLTDDTKGAKEAFDAVLVLESNNVEALDGLDAALAKELSKFFSEAERLLSQGDYAGAELIYNKTLDDDPYNEQAYFGLARVDSLQKKYDLAIKGFQKVCELNPGNIDALVGLAYTLAWSGKYLEAQRQFEKAVSLDSDRLDAQKGLGYIFLWKGAGAEALQIFEAIRQQAPQDIEAYIGIGRCKLSSGDLRGAEKAFKKALELDPNGIAASQGLDSVLAAEYMDLFSDAERLTSQGAYGASELIYEKILDKNPSNEQALFFLAHVRSRQKKYELAIDDFKKVLQLNPENSDALVGLAYTLAWSGKYTEAHEQFEKAVTVDPSRIDVQKGLAFIALWLKRVPDAIERFQKLGRDFPDDPDIEVGLGQSLLSKGDFKGAERSFKRALELDSTRRDATDGIDAIFIMELEAEMAEELEELYEEAKQRVREGDHAGAEKIYDEMLSRSPKSDAVRISRAYVRSWQGDYKRAEQDFEAVLKKRPESVSAFTGLGYNLAWAGNYEDAKIRFQQALAINPNLFEARKGLADANLWQGNMKEAVALLESLIKDFPDNVEAQVALARAKLSLKDHRGALKHFRKALEIDPTQPVAIKGVEYVNNLPSLFEVSLWGSYTRSTSSRKGFRRSRITWRPNPNFQLWTRIDNSLSLDIPGIASPRKDFPSYHVGTGLRWLDRFTSSVEVGMRRLPGGVKQTIVGMEQDVALPHGVHFKTGTTIAPRTKGRGDWSFYQGLNFLVHRRLRIEPLFYYAKTDGPEENEKRMVVSGHTRLFKDIRVSSGFGFGHFHSANRGSSGRLFSQYISTSIPFLGSNRLYFLFRREDPTVAHTFNAFEAGVSIQLPGT
jgi:superkiller protein 3